MGVVYKARDPMIDRVVAIKTIREADLGADAQLLTRLRMEAKSAGRLQHPNIVTIYDFGEQDDLAYLVMEYVEGMNLARVISSGAPLSLNAKMEILIQLCDGLGYAHDLGVIHRDIKPANICLTERGDPKLLDFGLARFDQTRLTRSGLATGTISYMSPERLSGESGPSDDIFALGAVAYEILTYKRAFPGATMSQVVSRICSGTYPVPPSQVADVPGELDAVIARATAVDKSNRYQTAKDFARALRDVLHSSTFQRRSPASAADAFKTIAMISPLDNPYTAGEIAGARESAAEASSHEVQKEDARTEVLDVRPMSPPPPTPHFDDLYYIKTEQVESPVAKKPPSPESAPEKSRSATFRIVDLTRTVMARVRPKRKEMPPPSIAPHAPMTTGTMPGTMPIPAAPVAQRHPLLFAASAVALLIATAALSLAWAAGPFPFLATYAAAVGAWFFLLRFGEQVSLKSVMLIALVLQASVVWQAPLDPARLDRELAIGRALISEGTTAAVPTAGTPPLAAVILAGWAATGGGLIVRRIVLIIAALFAAWLLWDAKAPRRALGLATVPLLLLEGTLNARLEMFACMLLVVALSSALRRRDGVAALSVIFATGVVASAVVTIPVVYDASWQVFIFMGAALVALVVPKLILPSTTTWNSALGSLVAGSPLLAFVARRFEIQLHDWGTANFLNGAFTAIAKSVGTTHEPFSEFALASAVVLVVLIVTIWVIAVRADKNEAGMADAIGLTLLALVTLDPAAWLLVVPFAIAGNRLFWLLVALCSPLLIFAQSAEGVNWIVYGMSLVIPAAWYLAMRSKNQSGLNAAGDARVGSA